MPSLRFRRIPATFAIVCGPLGATGPDSITNHSFANIKAIADSLAAIQVAAGIDPVGLQNYPGLHDLAMLRSQYRLPPVQVSPCHSRPAATVR